MATPEQIAAAWGAWHSRHGGKLGPGPGFVEAINAALAVSPDPRIETLERNVEELRAALTKIEARERGEINGSSYDIAHRALRDAGGGE